MSNSESGYHNKKFVYVVGILAILLWFGSVYVYRQQKDIGQFFATNFGTPDVKVQTQGSIALTLLSTAPVRAGQQVVVQIVASSVERDVVGYDLLISSEDVSFGAVRSLIPEFQVFTNQPTPEKKHLTITGAKAPGITGKTVFTGPIVELTVVPKAKGKLTLSLVERVGAEKTQMVDSATKTLRPALTSLTIDVQ